MSVIEAKNIKKAFSSGEGRIEVLQGIDLRVESGETISITGESGSGKSTLLNILAGLESKDGGEIYWKEKSLAQFSRKETALKRATFIGMIFQSYYLIPELSVFENVFLASRIIGKTGEPEHQRAKLLLERVGLKQRLKSSPIQLSGGERQRVAVARALMNSPQVIFADEPTGNLDEVTGKEVMDLLFEICREEKNSLLLVTHNPCFANQTDKKLLLHDGRLSPALEDQEK